MTSSRMSMPGSSGGVGGGGGMVGGAGGRAGGSWALRWTARAKAPLSVYEAWPVSQSPCHVAPFQPAGERRPIMIRVQCGSEPTAGSTPV